MSETAERSGLGGMCRRAWQLSSPDVHPHRTAPVLSVAALYPALFDGASTASVSPGVALGDGRVTRVAATVTSGAREHGFMFEMVRADAGKYRGCWVTKRLLPADSKWLASTP